MGKYYDGDVEKRPRIQKLIDDLYDHMPEIEADRAVILTESYKETEDEPIILRRAKAPELTWKQIGGGQRPGFFQSIPLAGWSDEFDNLRPDSHLLITSEEAKQQLNSLIKPQRNSPFYGG